MIFRKCTVNGIIYGTLKEGDIVTDEGMSSKSVEEIK
jgi:hypothetical protein